MLLETHSHTSTVSPCGKLNPQELIHAYQNAGYRGIVITDHLFESGPIFDADISWKEKCDRLFEGYRLAAEAGKAAGIHVYPAFELRFTYMPGCDFLVYGMGPDILPSIPEPYKMTLEEFRRAADREGALIVQAHPFRSYGAPANPALLDGVEVFNGNPRHNSQNDKALKFAEDHGLLKTAGSDTHQIEDAGRGAIKIDRMPEDDHDLAEVMKEGGYQLKVTEEKLQSAG